MDLKDTRTPSSSSNPAASPAGSTPRPTSGRENTGLMYFFIGAAVLALLLVLGFNMLGPEGASRTGIADGPAQSSAGPTTGGPSPSAGSSTGSSAGSPGGATGTGTQGQSGSTGGAAGTAAPAPAADTPTPPGRESVGAPAGGAPQSGQARPPGISGDGTTAGDAPPMAASPGASAIPAAPPASR